MTSVRCADSSLARTTPLVAETCLAAPQCGYLSQLRVHVLWVSEACSLSWAVKTTPPVCGRSRTSAPRTGSIPEPHVKPSLLRARSGQRLPGALVRHDEQDERDQALWLRGHQAAWLARHLTALPADVHVIAISIVRELMTDYDTVSVVVARSRTPYSYSSPALAARNSLLNRGRRSALPRHRPSSSYAICSQLRRSSEYMRNAAPGGSTKR